jgi:hypothetical protein
VLADPLQLGVQIRDLAIEIQADVAGPGPADRQSLGPRRERGDHLRPGGIAIDREGVAATLGVHPRLELAP